MRQIAGLIGDNLKPNDTLARLGGDEFAVLMRDCQLTEEVVAANKILDKVKRFQFIWKKSCFNVGVSIGVAEISRDSGNFGCQFALDDFGSGLSSFAYLKNLPVNTLKIDGIFIKDILTNPIDAAMVKSINEIGHLMKLKTIAEFVESDAIKQKVDAIGIDFAQGYGIGKPQPIDKMLTLNKLS